MAKFAALSLLLGCLVIGVFLPTSGSDTNPPTCSSPFGFGPPCGSEAEVLSAAAAVTVVAFGFCRMRRKHRP